MWMASGQDTNSHHREKIVGSVRVVVNTAEEGCGTIFANHLDDKMSASGMLFDKFRNIVDETRDENQGSLGSLLLV